MDIKYLFLLLGSFFSFLTLEAMTDIDSVYISHLWAKIHNSGISDDGKWAVTRENRYGKSTKTCITNIETRESLWVDGVRVIHFINSSKIVYQKGEFVYLVDLNSKKETIIDNVVSFDVFDKKKLLIHTKDFQLFLLDISGKIKKRWQTSSVVQFFISPQQRRLMFLKNGHVMALDLSDLTIEPIKGENGFGSLSNLSWSSDENHIIGKTVEGKLLYINMNAKNCSMLDVLPLRENLAHASVSFPTNTTVLIKQVYREKKNEANVDIWYTNDNSLEDKKNSTKKEKFTSASILYNLETQQSAAIDSAPDYTILSVLNENGFVAYDNRGYKDNNRDSSHFILYHCNLRTLKKTVIARSLSNYPVTISENKRFLAFRANDYWHLYDLLCHTVTEINLPHTQGDLYWTTDSNILLISDCNLWSYNTITHALRPHTSYPSGDNVNIDLLNYQASNVSLENTGTVDKVIHLTQPLIVKRTDLDNNTTTIDILKDLKLFSTIIKETPHKISQIHWNDNITTLSFREEDYGVPPRVAVFHNRKLSIVRESPIPDSLYNWRKQKIIGFTTVQGKSLNGILYYPKNFSEGRKYPMIVHLYERQSHLRNNFEIPTFENFSGYNISLLVEQGFFVFQPDTYVSEKGPGVTALECVESALLQVCKEEPQIDGDNIGLIGQSFGGYLVNYIITQTNLFKAAVSGSARSELIVDSYSYNYYAKRMNYYKLEDGQYRFGAPYANKRNVYFSNSPIYFAQNIATPLLLWAGHLDENVPWAHTMNLYGALRRYRKQSIAVFYTDDDHSLSKIKNQKDLTLKVLDWFSYFLKSDHQADWIRRGVDD